VARSLYHPALTSAEGRKRPHYVSVRTALFWIIPLLPTSGVENSRPLKIGPTGCPETSVKYYHYSLRNNPEKRSFRLLRAGSLKSHNISVTSSARGTVSDLGSTLFCSQLTWLPDLILVWFSSAL
jgi:hypothetical protein